MVEGEKVGGRKQEISALEQLIEDPDTRYDWTPVPDLQQKSLEAATKGNRDGAFFGKFEYEGVWYGKLVNENTRQSAELLILAPKNITEVLVYQRTDFGWEEVTGMAKTLAMNYLETDIDSEILSAETGKRDPMLAPDGRYMLGLAQPMAARIRGYRERSDSHTGRAHAELRRLRRKRLYGNAGVSLGPQGIPKEQRDAA